MLVKKQMNVNKKIPNTFNKNEEFPDTKDGKSSALCRYSANAF